MTPGAPSLRIMLLGPVEVLAKDGAVRLDGRYQRGLVAMLASEQGRLLTAARLIDALWGDHPPASARTKLHGHVSDIRKRLRAQDGWPIMTCRPGYLLSTDRVSVDLADYYRLRDAARQDMREGRYETASHHFAEALALWRGPAFSGAPSSSLVTLIADAIEQDRLLATERKAVCDLRLERYDEVVAELSLAIAAHPLREGMRGALMLALFRQGNRAGALHSYLLGDRLSREDVGISPGRELQALHKFMLRDDPVLATPEALGLLPGNAAPLAAVPGDA